MAVSYLRLKNNRAIVFCLNSDTKPTAVADYLLFEVDTGNEFYVSASAWVLKTGGGAAWGDIIVTLANQTDLQNALNLKAPLISPTLVTPVLGVATATTINGATITSGTLNGTVIGTNTGDQIISDATISTTDITTNNVSTSKHGFAPKVTNTANFLKGDGTWASPTASVAIYQTEVDFGSVPLKMKKFTITDAGVTSGMKIIPTMSYDNPSDGEADSAEWFEDITLSARADTGQFFLYINSPYQDLTGKLKVNYIYAT